MATNKLISGITQIRNIVRKLSHAKMELDSFYVYGDKSIQNDINLSDAIDAYIARQDEQGYLAIGINYTLEGEDFPLAMDIFNNKHDVASVCEDYQRNYTDAYLHYAFKAVIDKTERLYAKRLKEEHPVLHSEYVNNLFDLKLKQTEDRLKLDELLKKDVPHIKVGIFEEIRIVAERNGYVLAVNDKELRNERNLPQSAITPYITWFKRRGEFYYGRYFNNSKRAWEDFNARAGEV